MCLIIFFFLLSFIHELKWLWAVTSQFFTALWTDGRSKNTSILAVSNRLDLPKQHCRHFIKSKEIKTHLHITIFFSVIKTQPVAVGSADTHCPPGKPEVQPQGVENSCRSYHAVLVVHLQPQCHSSPTLQEQKEGGTWREPHQPHSPAHPALSRAAAMGFAHPKEKPPSPHVGWVSVNVEDTITLVLHLCRTSSAPLPGQRCNQVLKKHQASFSAQPKCSSPKAQGYYPTLL